LGECIEAALEGAACEEEVVRLYLRGRIRPGVRVMEYDAGDIWT